jgi:hypothetical protein
MDPLSEVLSLLKLRSYMSGAFEAAGGWSIAFGAHEGIKFQAVTCGECWVALEGTDKAVRLMAGDCLLLPHGRPFRIASDLTLPPIDFSAFSGGVENGITSFNGGGEFMSIGGYFTLVGDHTSILLGLLPPIVHIRGESQTVLRWCLERLSIELRNPQPGGFLVAQQLVVTIAPGGRNDRGRWLALRSCKQTYERRNPSHACQSIATLDIAITC